MIGFQCWLSQQFDRCLPKRFRIDGNAEYDRSIAPGFVRPGITLFDVGGGKRPFLDFDDKRRLEIQVIGLDIDQHELSQAPSGSYDQAICADLCSFCGNQSADLAVCRALLEHVRDTEAAINSLASILKPGGRLLVFTPSRNAVYARLNLLLPEGVKRSILRTVYPQTAKTQGFPAYYNRCTPRDFRRLAQQAGLTVERELLYFESGYFRCCFPVHVVWRLAQLCLYGLIGEQAAETFTLVLKKPGACDSESRISAAVAA